ncbi:hypothetical protein ABZU88_35440, partial [Streptomyces sp. NPDC005245]|uniref:hypothetical protein n=1 Tax=Streptomyces sp. NPDC005245 TaxID=3157029 RepID=UPI0033B8A481
RGLLQHQGETVIALAYDHRGPVESGVDLLSALEPTCPVRTTGCGDPPHTRRTSALPSSSLSLSHHSPAA